MKKKIITILVIGMFLLISSTSIIVLGKKTVTSEQKTTNNDLPDLTIKINVFPSAYIYQVWATPTIYNQGKTEIPKETVLVWRLVWSDGTTKGWGKMPLGEPLKPGEKLDLWSGPVLYRSDVAGRKLLAIVDPPGDEHYVWKDLDPDPEYGLIEESNENNNIGSHTFPKVKAFTQFGPLSVFLNRFPLLARLLQL